MKDPLTDLDHPSECFNFLLIPQTRVEPCEVRCCPFICHRVHRGGVDGMLRTGAGEERSIFRFLGGFH